MKIRKATLKDVPMIVEMWEGFMDEHSVMVRDKELKYKEQDEFAENRGDNYKEFISGFIEKGNGAIFIAEEDEAVGYCLVFIKDNIPIFKVKKLGYASDLFVKKEFRGKGISSKLVEEALKWFKEKGLKHISLQTYCSNDKARSIYKKMGFFEYKVEMRKKL